MRKIKFLQDYTVQAENGESYKKGDEKLLPLPSAEHFVSRGVAEYVVMPKPTTGPVRNVDATKVASKAENEKKHGSLSRQGHR